MATIPTKPGPEQLGVVASRVVEELRDKQADPEKYRPIPFKIGALDAVVGGVVLPSYIALGGPAKIGKTAVAIHIALTLGAAKRGKVGAYHLEELRSQYAIRAMTTLTDSADRVKIRDLTLTPHDIKELDKAAQQLTSVDVFIEDHVYMVSQILAQAKSEGFKVIIIDTFNLVEGGVGRDEWKRLESISKMFLRARNDEDLTVILIYQLNDAGRAYGTRQPYRDADLIIEVEEAIDEVSEDPIPGMLTLHVLPSRQAPETSVNVAFDGAHSRIADPASLMQEIEEVIDGTDAE